MSVQSLSGRKLKVGCIGISQKNWKLTYVVDNATNMLQDHLIMVKNFSIVVHKWMQISSFLCFVIDAVLFLIIVVFCSMIVVFCVIVVVLWFLVSNWCFLNGFKIWEIFRFDHKTQHLEEKFYCFWLFYFLVSKYFSIFLPQNFLGLNSQKI